MANQVVEPKWAPNKCSLVRGQADNIAIFLLQADGAPLNIAGATAITLLFKNANDETIEKAADTGWTYGLGEKAFYIYGFAFTTEETLTLKLGEKQKVVVKIIYGDRCRFLTIDNCLTVEDMGMGA